MQCLNLKEYLSGNEYPGRGILLGRSADGSRAVAAYFIMGRSQNSRNRIFAATGDGIRTEAADPAKLEDPSLIIYHPVRILGGTTIVTNGDQTDTIRDFLADGKTYVQALRTRAFEPDGPNYTPRISGILGADGSIRLSILKSLDGNPELCIRNFYEYDTPLPGVGFLIHTYEGNGRPLPSFNGDPTIVTIPDTDIDTLGEMLWNSLNEDNKVSLWVSTITENGDRESRIYNKYTRS